MELVREVCERGVVERRVGLEVGGETVPGIVWLPEDAVGPRPTVILGHGGVVHKRAPEVLGLARRLVRHQGYAAVALDVPEHGERITDEEAARARRRSVQARIDQGPGAGLPMVMDANQRAGFAARMGTHVGELTALVDDLATTGFIDDRLGYWGLSMGTGIGLRFVASEPKVKAAVLGLAGLGAGMGGAEFETTARSLRSADPVPPPVGRRVDRPRRRSRSLRCDRLDGQDPPRQPRGSRPGAGLRERLRRIVLRPASRRRRVAVSTCSQSVRDPSTTKRSPTA